MSLQILKNMNLDRVLDNDEAVFLSAEARALMNEFEELDIPIPEWLGKATEMLREEIARRNRSTALAEVKRLESELEGYKSVTEKRGEAQRRLGELQKQLGLAGAGAAKGK